MVPAVQMNGRVWLLWVVVELLILPRARPADAEIVLVAEVAAEVAAAVRQPPLFFR